MFITIIILAVILLLVVHFQIKRRNAVVYRKRVARPHHGYSITDHPCAFGTDQPSAPSESVQNMWSSSDPGPELLPGFAGDDAFAFGGGDFGGGGAADSYDSGPNDSTDSSSTDTSGDYSGSDQSW